MPIIVRLVTVFFLLLTTAHATPVMPGTASGHLAVQYHCAGEAKLANSTNLVSLRKIISLPSARDVHKLFVTRVAGLLSSHLHAMTDTNAGSLIAPLLGDILENESWGSFDGGATNRLSFVVACAADGKQARFWQENLSRAFGMPGDKFSCEDFGGWQWHAGTSNSLWIVSAQNWLVVGCGEELSSQRDEYLRRVKQQGRPGPVMTDNWLEAELDWARLRPWLSDWGQILKPAHVKIAVADTAADLVMTAHVVYSDEIHWRSGSWPLPDGFLQNPMISFTTGQDLEAFFNLSPAVQRLEGNPLTNRFYIWALDQMPFLSYMVWPVANASNALRSLSATAPALFNPSLKRFNGTELVWADKIRRLVLSNLRVVTPAVEAVHDKHGDLLLLSFFPRVPPIKPPPTEVWKQIKGRTNLVYYDWEITGARLQEWRLLGRMILTQWHPTTEDESNAMRVEDKWLGDLRTLAGNAVTEITVEGSSELSVIRTSPIGFSGIELFLLSEWLAGLGVSQ